MPRFLARTHRTVRRTNPVEEFDFEEDVARQRTSKRFCWANSAYAMATNINRSFKELRLVLAAFVASSQAARSQGLPTFTLSRPTTAAWTCDVSDGDRDQRSA